MKPSIPSQDAGIQSYPRLPSRRALLACASFLFLLLASSAFAADKPRENHPVPAKGPLVSELREETEPDASLPETVIRKYEDAQGNQVRELSINGAVFEIQVIPANGPPYYLIDNDGDGLYETRLNGYEPKILVPQWVLFRF